MTIVDILFTLLFVYLFCGLVFALAFIMKGVNVVDEGAHGSSIGFRIIIIPGTAVFWPLLLMKWLRVKNKKHND